MNIINCSNILEIILYKYKCLALSVSFCLLAVTGIAQCSPTSKTFGAASSYSGVLGTSVVTVKVTPPTKDNCVVYGLCTSNNSNGMRVDKNCGGAYNINFMWSFFKTDSTGKIGTLNTITGSTLCPNLPIKKPTLTLTISPQSHYKWLFDKTGLVYVSLNSKDTLVFTISETDSSSPTQINNYFTSCSDTTLHICSDLNWYFYNDPSVSNTLPSLSHKDTLLKAYHPLAKSYQWYRNEQPIPGDTLDSLVIFQPGFYYVEVTFASGCSASSEQYGYKIISGVPKPVFLEKVSFSIWPNPSNSILNITGEYNKLSELKIDLIDLTGRIVQSNLFDHINGHLDERIDISQLKTGLYFLKIETGNRTVCYKIIKPGY